MFAVLIVLLSYKISAQTFRDTSSAREDVAWANTKFGADKSLVKASIPAQAILNSREYFFQPVVDDSLGLIAIKLWGRSKPAEQSDTSVGIDLVSLAELITDRYGSPLVAQKYPQWYEVVNANQDTYLYKAWNIGKKEIIVSVGMVTGDAAVRLQAQCIITQKELLEAYTQRQIRLKQKSYLSDVGKF